MLKGIFQFKVYYQQNYQVQEKPFETHAVPGTKTFQE